MKNTLFLLSALLLNAPIAFAQNHWSPVTETQISRTGIRQIIPQRYQTQRLDQNNFKSLLFSAPHEKQGFLINSSCVIELPLPDGSYQHFKVVESPIIMEPLATQFPDMKTFSLKGIEDPRASGKADWNEFGFHAMLRTTEGDIFIDPYCVGNTRDYLVYYKADFVKEPTQRLPEAGLELPSEAQRKAPSGSGAQNKVSSQPPAICVGPQLKTYRLAVACTGEYAVAATGLSAPTVSQTLAKIVTSVNRVDGVYETDVAIRLVLVPTETAVVFTNASTDPFTGNNNSGTLINESQTVITASIGSANFDIGHTFSTGGGGLAFLGCVCNNGSKARGITGSPSPVGDPYDIDYVAHEMGHQFGGNHTFNANTGSCNGNRNGSTAVEPGSGITIMAYAGICGANDLDPHSIAYFHPTSYDEVVNFAHSGSGNSCAVTSTTGNQAPVVNPSTSFIVPKGTPFYLSSNATDPDGDSLSFSWEEIDVAANAGNWNSGFTPYFMSYNPVTSRTRYFPKLSVVNSGNYTGTKGEYLTSTPQTLKFRFTARDNKMGGGGVCYSNYTVTVDATGPFAVTYPSAPAIFWLTGSQQTITWDLNGTDFVPINCDSVRVSISYNSGNTYSVLLPSTPNDGTELITVPTVSANISTCRIKIEAKGKWFYDVSNNNFTITTDVGISQISDNNPLALSLWPNPANETLCFALSNLADKEVVKLRVMDLLGKVSYQKEFRAEGHLKSEIDITNLQHGLYLLELSQGGRTSLSRFVKD
ncbi:MAG TPA: M12 family metallo-peptidase [Bacteroidia bacterium]|nr:M12 family metallo-peptidase [Bacteroidia bacterium]